MRADERKATAALAGIAAGRADAVREELGLWGPIPAQTTLDPRTLALVRLAALISLDAPPAAFARQVSAAEEAGVAPAEMVATLQAIGPQIGSLKAISAAAEIMVALGLTLPEAPHEDGGADEFEGIR